MPKPLDVWAYGITIFVYLFNNLPYADFEEKEKDFDIEALQDKINFQELIDQKCEGKFSDDLIDLMKKVLNKDPVQRLTFK